MRINPIDLILDQAVQQLEKLHITGDAYKLPETIEESDLMGLNNYAFVSMYNDYMANYDNENPKMKRLFGIPFGIAVYLYVYVPAFRRRMNWVFSTISIYFLNYRYYVEKSLMPSRWDMADEQIKEDIKEKGY